MDELIKGTFDEVQAALLNSEQDPQREIFTAFCAVTSFAEGEGMTKAQMRSVFEEALERLKEEPQAAPERPGCFGKCHAPLDPLCAGGPDHTYRDASGSNVRPACDFFAPCGEVSVKQHVVPLKKKTKNKDT